MYVYENKPISMLSIEAAVPDLPSPAFLGGTDVVAASLAKVLKAMISCKYCRIKQINRVNHDN
jgi:hypothetical protein